MAGSDVEHGGGAQGRPATRITIRAASGPFCLASSDDPGPTFAARKFKYGGLWLDPRKGSSRPARLPDPGHTSSTAAKASKKAHCQAGGNPSTH